MHRFIQRAVKFSCISSLLFAAYIYAAKQLLPISMGINTRGQIETSFYNALNKNYEILILGNSRMYRGINPDIFDLTAYNFSHDNDRYNQMYYKLVQIFKNGKNKNIKFLLLGVDYFQFSKNIDTKNYVYAELFGDDYMKDYPKRPSIFFEINLLSGIRQTKSISKNMVRTLFNYRIPKKLPYLKENGQYIKDLKGAKESDTVFREYQRIPLQEYYFKKILQICKNKNIIVFLTMPPTRKNELEFYPQEVIEEYESFFRSSLNENNYYLNYSTSNRFNILDFTDITHINSRAADRFSKIVNIEINKLHSKN
jgi:hypothetical protein